MRLALALLLAARALTSAGGVQVAVTVDDLPVHGPAPPGVSRSAIIERMLAAFAAHHLPPVYGFVNGKAVDDDPATEAALRRWTAAGHALGNHSWSHPSLNTTPLDAYLDDVRRDEDILARVAPRPTWKVFWYPFLQQGDTVAKRDGVRRFLTEAGYTIADVTIDADDWAYNPPYARCARRRDLKALADLRRSFVSEHVDELRRVRAVTRALAGREVPQVLLLHAGAADADAIDALLTAFEAEGARWVDLRVALADPFYAPATHAPVPDGSALPYVLARERGLTIDPPAWARGLEARLRAVCR
ncbi:MAG TPA: polysaccharide deacetylase family protein [Polyangia bacterium]|nr:polysaccharide deacetylase family protein [Polyangia bacterium]